jgi:hypothetical protein
MARKPPSWEFSGLSYWWAWPKGLEIFFSPFAFARCISFARFFHALFEKKGAATPWHHA